MIALYTWASEMLVQGEGGLAQHKNMIINTRLLNRAEEGERD